MENFRRFKIIGLAGINQGTTEKLDRKIGGATIKFKFKVQSSKLIKRLRFLQQE